MVRSVKASPLSPPRPGLLNLSLSLIRRQETILNFYEGTISQDLLKPRGCLKPFSSTIRPPRSLKEIPTFFEESVKLRKRSIA